MTDTNEPDQLHARTEALREHLSQHEGADDGALRARVVAQGRWQNEQTRRLRLARRILGLGAALYVGLFAWLGSSFFGYLAQLERAGELPAGARMNIAYEMGFGVSMPLLIAIVGLWLAHRGSFVAQLASRAIYWGLSIVVVWGQSVLLTNAGLEDEVGTLSISSAIAMVATFTCVGVLAALGDHGLRSPLRTPFEPVAFRGLLLLSLVMGLADAMLLGFIGLESLVLGGSFIPVALGLALWLGAGAWGLLRLRVWGLAAMAAGNLLELVAVGAGGLDALGDLVLFLVATAVVQLLLPVPVYGAMLSKTRARAPRPSSILRHLPAVVLVAAAGFSVVQFALTLLRS